MAINFLKKNKGVTLVVLVVTIVVIIILATISINAVFSENGLLKQAQKTQDIQENYEAAEEADTNELLTQHGNVMEAPKISTWVHGTYDQNAQTVTNGEITLKIGDYVNYDHVTGATTLSYTSEQAKNGYGDQTFTVADYKYGWRVLGVDDYGRLLLIAEDFVPLTGGYEETTSGRTFFYLGNTTDKTLGRSVYVNGVSELDNIGKIYGQGYGAIEARSVKVYDINKITGYDPTATGTGKPSGSGGLSEYGNEVTYTLTGGKVYYQGTKQPTTSTSSSFTSFIYYDGTNWITLSEGESSIALKGTYYAYYPYSLSGSSSTTGTLKGISLDSTAYKMLFTNSSTGAYSSASGTTSNYQYWLADAYVYNVITSPGRMDYGMRRVMDGYVRGYSICASHGTSGGTYQGVRPVVTLSSDVQLMYSGENKDDCALWNLI